MRVSINPAGTTFTVLQDEHYPNAFCTVPAGFMTDFTSTPRWLWMIYPPLGYYAHAALLHDYIYVCHRQGDVIFTRQQADRLFREQMKIDGVGWRTRWTLWLAVRVFAGFPWIKV